MNDFKNRVNRLSTQQMLLLANLIGVENTTKHREQNGSTQSIAAYFVADEPIGTNDLRESLKDKLPEYMIPSKFIQLDELPLLPNGKIDVNSLKVPVEEEISHFKAAISAPKTEVEIQLVEIWEEVLGVHPIGVQDNFFEIGGDSILSIQIVAKARHKGIFLAPNQLFEHQTISELARFAKIENKNSVEEIVAGNVPLLPVQHWFFEEHKNAPHHWNQAIMFDVPEDLNTDVLQKSIKFLIEHHDALRLGFKKTEEGWNAFIPETAEIRPFTFMDLSGSPANEINFTIEAKLIELQTNQDLSKAGLFQGLFFKCAQGNKNKLLLVAHHLLVDGISWQILLSDLESIYRQLSRNQEITLSSKTTSYHKWANHLIQLSISGEFDDEIEFWRQQSCFEKIPTDNNPQLPVYQKSINTIALEFDLTTTENLVNETYHTKTDELLIAALMFGFEKWANIKSLCIGLEKHGRNYSNLDLTNVVGCFNTHFPVSLKIEDGSDIRSSIISIKEKLRSIPNDGIGYGVLRYLNKMKGLTQNPSVIFNFLGNQSPFESYVLGKGNFITKGIRAANSERHHLLEINALIEEGILKLQWSYCEQFHKKESIEILIEIFETALRQVIEHCLSRQTREHSPSDFPEANLSKDDFDTLLNQIS